MSGMAIGAPVKHGDLGIVFATGTVPCIRLSAVQMARFNVCSYHHIPFCAAMYFWIISCETLPAVAAKYERVQSDGNFRKTAYRSRRTRLVRPLTALTTSAALVFGQTWTKR